MFFFVLRGAPWIGTVGSCRGQAIRTQFVWGGLPLFPLRSMFITKMGGGQLSLSGGTPVGGVSTISGYPIPLNIKSIVATYLKWWGWLVPIVFLFNDDRIAARPPITDPFIRNCMIVYMAAYIGTCIGIHFAWGQGRRRRILMGMVTGVCVDPRVLRREDREMLLVDIQNRLWWQKIAPDLEYWRDRTPNDAQAALVYCLAAISEVITPGVGWRQVADRVFEQAWKSRAQVQAPRVMVPEAIRQA